MRHKLTAIIFLALMILGAFWAVVTVQAQATPQAPPVTLTDDQDEYPSPPIWSCCVIHPRS